MTKATHIHWMDIKPKGNNIPVWSLYKKGENVNGSAFSGAFSMIIQEIKKSNEFS